MNEENITTQSVADGVSEQNRLRIEKLNELRETGKSPYINTKFPVDSSALTIRENFESLENSDVVIAGRITSWRDMGKANFIDIRDHSDRIQVYVKTNDVGESVFNEFKTWDLGDIIGVKGTVFKTRKGEISIHAKELVLLSKSLFPLPEKWHGLRDKEERYRKRYLDFIANPDVKKTFITRCEIIKQIRNYLDNLGFIEMETPVLHTLEIGAAARPFITKHNALDIDMYLRIETELYLKKLIVGGFNKVYEVGSIFRNEGMDSTHNPEFTSVELYQAYTDYFGMMTLIEDMFKTITKNVCDSETITYRETAINMGGESPWERMTMREAVKKYADCDYNDWADDQAARVIAKSKGIEISSGATKGDVLIALFEEFAEKELIQPTFIYDYPVENSPLAKRKADNPAFTERFEFFIYGWEFGNAFSELNDPIDQRERFTKQVEQRRLEGANAELDEDFLTALEYGLPPTGGLGFGVDRFVMLLTDSASIRDVLLFPTMRP